MKKQNLFNLLITTNIGIFISIFFIMDVLVNIFFWKILEINFQNENKNFIQESGGKAAVFFIAVIIAPIFETLIYQFSIIKIIRFIIKNSLLVFFIAIPLSALILALDHNYSANYQINAFFAGLIYAMAFFAGEYRRDLPAFIIVAIIHSLWNLFAFIMN